MLVVAPSEVVRLVGVWARRADAGLARSAALNAARCVEVDRIRRLDDARTIRDLQHIPAALSSSTTPTGQP